MNYAHVVTLILIYIKLMGYTNISWLLVLSPSLLPIFVGGIIIIIAMLLVAIVVLLGGKS